MAMEVQMSSPAEINRVDFLNKKRKFQVEAVGVPLPKHVRWGQVLEYDSSSDSTKKTKKTSELEPNSINNDLHRNLDSTTMFTCHKDVADLGYPKIRASNGTSSSFSVGMKGRSSITKPSSSESETLSKYAENLLGFGIRSDFGYSDYADYKELKNLLNSSGIDPRDYVLSSGRWSDDQGGGKKLTIDDEFEQYFGMLML